MTVAYIFGSLNHGGIETLYLDLFRNKDKIPYDFVCIHKKQGTLLDEYYKTGISIHKVHCKHFLSPSYIWRLRRFLIEHKVTLVHTQMAEDTIMVKIAMLGRHIETVQSVHAFDYGLKFYIKKYIQWTFRHNKKILFVSDYQRKHYESLYDIPSGCSVTVHNCMSFDKLRASKLTSELPVNDANDFKMGMVGNFCSGRNQMAICKALSLLMKINSHFTFYFIGRREEDEPQYFDSCVSYCKENGLSDRVFFLGVRSDVPAILKYLDAFVYSTVHDTFAISVLEAMASGIPCLVNDWPVMEEITLNGKFATIYKSDNPEDLSEKMGELIKNYAVYSSSASSNVTAVQKEYGVEHFISQLNSIYVE